MAYLGMDLPFVVFIRPEWGKREESYKERFFHAMHNGGGPPMDSSNSMKGVWVRQAFYMKMKRKRVKPYHILLNNLTEWGRALYVVSLDFTTIWNARNFDWWKPVYEDSPFSDVQFPSFGKHQVSQQMNISLSLSCSLYVVWKLLQGSNE